MVIQANLILTPEQNAAAEALNEQSESVKVMGRRIDNPLANNLGDGVLVGMYMLPARILNAPEYAIWHDMLSTLPIRTQDCDVLFLPEEFIP